MSKKFDKWQQIDDTADLEDGAEIKIDAKVILNVGDESLTDLNLSVIAAENDQSATNNSNSDDWPISCYHSEEIDIKHKKYVFKEPSYDLDTFLPLANGGERLLKEFKAGLDQREKRKAQNRVAKICGAFLMSHCETPQFPLPLEKAKMAYSIYCKFPFWICENPAALFPWQHIYCPISHKGHLETYITHKRSNDTSIQTQKYVRHSTPISKKRKSDLVPMDEDLADEIVIKYPALLDYPKLILSDFHLLMAKEGQTMMSNFSTYWTEQLAPILVEVAAKEKSSIGLQQIFFDFGVDIANDGIASIKSLDSAKAAQLALIVLPYLLKPTNPKKKNSKQANVSRLTPAAAIKRMIQFDKVGEDIETAISDRVKQDPDIRQPWILAFSRTGSYGDDVEEVFIILDKRAIRVAGDLGEIVEMLIGCYYTFDVEFPASLTHVYVFLELVSGLKATNNVGAQVNNLLGVVRGKKS